MDPRLARGLCIVTPLCQVLSLIGSDRICTICGHNVEDETHLLFHCRRYSSIRDNFFSKIDHIISNPKQLSISTLIVQVMNSTYEYAASAVYIVLY